MLSVQTCLLLGGIAATVSAEYICISSDSLGNFYHPTSTGPCQFGTTSLTRWVQTTPTAWRTRTFEAGTTSMTTWEVTTPTAWATFTFEAPEIVSALNPPVTTLPTVTLSTLSAHLPSETMTLTIPLRPESMTTLTIPVDWNTATMTTGTDLPDPTAETLSLDPYPATITTDTALTLDEDYFSPKHGKPHSTTLEKPFSLTHGKPHWTSTANTTSTSELYSNFSSTATTGKMVARSLEPVVILQTITGYNTDQSPPVPSVGVSTWIGYLTRPDTPLPSVTVISTQTVEITQTLLPTQTVDLTQTPLPAQTSDWTPEPGWTLVSTDTFPEVSYTTFWDTVSVVPAQPTSELSLPMWTSLTGAPLPEASCSSSLVICLPPTSSSYTSPSSSWCIPPASTTYTSPSYSWCIPPTSTTYANKRISSPEQSVANIEAPILSVPTAASPAMTISILGVLSMELPEPTSTTQTTSEWELVAVGQPPPSRTWIFHTAQTSSATSNATTHSSTSFPKRPLASHTIRDVAPPVKAHCVPQPTGKGPVIVPDTFGAFLNSTNITSLALLARIPKGFSLSYSNVHYALTGPDYISYTPLDSYNTTRCAAECDLHPGCATFNIFVERAPRVSPGPACADPPSTSIIKCSLWRSAVGKTVKHAKNEGYKDEKFVAVIAGSNIYVRGGKAVVEEEREAKTWGRVTLKRPQGDIIYPYGSWGSGAAKEKAGEAWGVFVVGVVMAGLVWW